jgi:hypothetical protein
MSKLLSLYDASLHPEVRKRGLNQNHLRDALYRGILRRDADDLVTGKNAARKVYAITEEALLEFLDTDPEPHPWVTKSTQPAMTRAKFRAQVSASQRKEALFRLKRELICEAREYGMTLEQYLDYIDFDADKRKELAQLGQGFYPSPHNMEDDDDRQREAIGFGEEDPEESLLCGEESGGDDDDALSLGDFSGLVE